MTTPRKNQGSSRNGFIIALICSVGLAFLFPSPGAKGSWMHPDLLNNAGVALILFLQGLGMAVEQMKTGAGNWRLHLIVQSGTNSVAYHVLSPVPLFVCGLLATSFANLKEANLARRVALGAGYARP